MAKKLFWFWLIILFLLNIIPLGVTINEKLKTTTGEGNTRLDYLAHTITFLVFAAIYYLRWKLRAVIFKEHELSKLICIILISAIGFEAVQYVLPYRTWNPIDLLYNLSGAVLATIIILLIYRGKRKSMEGADPL